MPLILQKECKFLSFSYAIIFLQADFDAIHFYIEVKKPPIIGDFNKNFVLKLKKPLAFVTMYLRKHSQNATAALQVVRYRATT